VFLDDTVTFPEGRADRYRRRHRQRAPLSD